MNNIIININKKWAEVVYLIVELYTLNNIIKIWVQIHKGTKIPKIIIKKINKLDFKMRAAKLIKKVKVRGEKYI